MKKLFLTIIILMCCMMAGAQNPLRLQPTGSELMPSDAVLKEHEQLIAKLNKDPGLSEKEYERLEELESGEIFDHFFTDHCSWYCGGEVSKVKASSHLKSQGRFSYQPENAHDFDYSAVWSEGVAGQGIGEWLEYDFEGSCPRVTTVCIMNGHVKNETAWKNNSRVKKLKMYYNGNPYAILELKDLRGVQYFDVGTLGYHDETKPHWKLRFEIMEVYPGDKFDDTIISELYFDGIDVH